MTNWSKTDGWYLRNLPCLRLKFNAYHHGHFLLVFEGKKKAFSLRHNLCHILQSSSNEDYEQVLASLALSIQKRQTQLSEIRLRERRATLLVTTWAFSVWVAYIALWWAGVVGGHGRTRNSALWGVPVVLGPVVWACQTFQTTKLLTSMKYFIYKARRSAVVRAERERGR